MHQLIVKILTRIWVTKRKVRIFWYLVTLILLLLLMISCCREMDKTRGGNLRYLRCFYAQTLMLLSQLALASAAPSGET